jgi:hypothetical protein
MIRLNALAAALAAALFPFATQAQDVSAMANSVYLDATPGNIRAIWAAQHGLNYNIDASRLAPNARNCLFTPPGTGAVARDCNPKISETEVSVTDFGVVMNDAVYTTAEYNLNTTRFQAAVNYISSIGGGRLKIPRGNLVLCQVNIPGNVWIDGDHAGASNLVQCSPTNTMLVASNTAGLINNVRISNLQILSGVNNLNQVNAVPQTSGVAIWFFNCDTCHVDHVRFERQWVAVHEDGSFATGGAGATVWSLLDHLSIGDNQFIGLDLVTPSDVHISDVLMRCTIGGPSVAGIRVQSTGGLWLSQLDIVGCGIGTWLAPNTGQTVKWLFLQNSAFGDSNIQNNGTAFFVNPVGAGARVGDIVITDAWMSSSKNGGFVSACGSGGTVDSIKITNLMAVGNGGPGVDAQCGTNLVFDTAILEGNSSGGIGTGSGPSGTYPGVRIGSGVSATIRDMECKPQPGDSTQMSTCVQLNAGSDNVTLTGTRVIAGAISGASCIVDNSTGTNVRIKDNQCYNPVGGAAITVGASPFTYTAGHSEETVYVTGGTVSAIATGGGTVATASPSTIQLGPNEGVTVTYSAAPTMRRSVH